MPRPVGGVIHLAIYRDNDYLLTKPSNQYFQLIRTSFVTNIGIKHVSYRNMKDEMSEMPV